METVTWTDMTDRITFSAINAVRNNRIDQDANNSTKHVRSFCIQKNMNLVIENIRPTDVHS